ncbi:MAG: imidazole glycerol phosphate synthase subunit HisF [Bacteroidetes bacterium]|nr:imidazole glycerol phosphate synthase subunit HisF [Bacteroidota bacterium]MBS1973262.1 imidazole glycerol phosphate synthase subunit HisF [Bacteroidota bacterium]
MRRIRVIPVLLLHKGGLVKSVKFKDYTYVGDPINAVKIFNEKEIDEIIILDIDASREKRPPDMQKIKEIAGEAFVPLAYGGGIGTIDDIKELFYVGVEKVVFNTNAYHQPELITGAAKLAGSQSIVVSMDVKKNIFGKYNACVKNGTENTKQDPLIFAKRMQELGAGEIFLNNIDRDGTYNGYDLELIHKISSSLSIPLIACGGASSVEDFNKAVQHGASAVAAGSMFVFQRPHRAVLISYPSQDELKEKLFSNIP